MEKTPWSVFNEIADLGSLLEPLGWSLFRENSARQYWRRPGKESGVSATFSFEHGLFFNFSSNAYPFEPGRAYSKFAIFCLLNFNNNFSEGAKFLLKNGFSKTFTNRPGQTKKVKPIPKFIEGQKIEFLPPVYKGDYSFEERAAILQYDSGLTRTAAEQICISEGLECVRLYRLSANRKILNKNLNPETLHSFSNFKMLNENFENFEISLSQLISFIRKGYAFCSSLLLTNYREEINFVGSELIFIDIDDQPIDKILSNSLISNALLIYSTPSHRPDNPRYRILFDLPGLLTVRAIYKSIVSKFIGFFRGDVACKSAVNIFYGSKNCELYDLRTGQIFSPEAS